MRAQFLKFIIVGAAATLTTYCVLIALVELWQVSPVPASMAGYVAGIVVNYTLNYRFTFRSEQLHQVVVPKFLVVVLVGMVLNAALMHAGVNWLGVHYAVAQLGAIAVIVIWSYAANRLWAFAG